MKLNTEILRPKKKSRFYPIILLHGFTGSSEDWVEISRDIDPDFALYAIDLPGHGKSDSPDEISAYTADAINQSIKETLVQLRLKKVIMLGYSMGGRAALSFTINYPEFVQALILESISAGIRDPKDRKARVINDEKISSLIFSGTIDNFTDYWMNIPLFETQKTLPNDKLAAIRINKLKNTRTGLANSLRGFGTGSMPSLWDDLKQISCPVLLITGEYDEKFKNINGEMNSIINNAAHHIVPDCGHTVHLEKPEHFLNLTNNFLFQNFKLED